MRGLFWLIAVFAAMASIVTTQGLGILWTYGKFMGEFYLGLIILWALLVTLGGNAIPAPSLDSAGGAQIVVNVDDTYGRRLAKSAPVPVTTFSAAGLEYRLVKVDFRLPSSMRRPSAACRRCRPASASR